MQHILQRRIIESIDATTSLAFGLLAHWGETTETLTELEDQNIQERLRSQYSRLNTLLLKVSESQPIASADMLNLLYRTVYDSFSFDDRLTMKSLLP